MTTMIVTPELFDFRSFHQWLDINAPGWKWKVPLNQQSVAMAIPHQVKSLEWALEGMVRAMTLRLDQPPLRVHYKFKTPRQAMLAKLTWGHMRAWR